MHTEVISWNGSFDKKITQHHYVDNLHSAPAIQSETLKYGHAELEKENEKEHEEIEGTVTPVIERYQIQNHHYCSARLTFLYKHTFIWVSKNKRLFKKSYWQSKGSALCEENSLNNILKLQISAYAIVFNTQ